LLAEGSVFAGRASRRRTVHDCLIPRRKQKP
jgi:hypothetical protein